MTQDARAHRRSTMQGRRYEKKVSCDRCGFTYRDGELVEQNGLMVCTIHCYDKPSYKETRNVT